MNKRHILICMMLLSAAACNSAPEAAPSQADDDRGAEANANMDAKIEAEMNLKAMLKDGDSAKFRKEFVSRISGGNLMLCGEVNSKNALGAYTGYQRFIASTNPDAPNLIEGETLAADDGSDKAFKQAYDFACSNHVQSFDY